MNHYLRSFHNGGDSVTLFQFKLVSATARDRTFNEVIPNTNYHVSHDVTKLYFFDFSRQFVSG